MGVLDYYDLITNNEKQKQKQKVNSIICMHQLYQPIPIYQYKNDVRVLSTAGYVSDTHLIVHGLEHYKHSKTTPEIGVRLRSCVEELINYNNLEECFSLETLNRGIL